MTSFIHLKLDTASSVELLHAIEKQPLPFQFVNVSADGEYSVWIDGHETGHTLYLNNDGTWHMTTTTEV